MHQIDRGNSHINVQDEVRKASAKVEHMITWGGGGSFDEYAIHPLELLVSVMSASIERLHTGELMLIHGRASAHYQLSDPD